MSTISFFTPIYYGSRAKTADEKAIENIDNYFHICGKKAVVIQNRTDNEKETVMLSETKFSVLTLLKTVSIVLSYFTVIIPHNQKITFNTEDGQQVVLIAEESMDINPEESVQEEFYHEYSKELDETARQLAIFVAKTGFNDVKLGNIPILNEADGFVGPRRIALIDLEHMESRIGGFIGGTNGSCGLIGCVSSQEQIDIVLEEARKNGVNIDEDENLYFLFIRYTIKI